MNRTEQVTAMLRLEAVAAAATGRARLLREELEVAARAELTEQGTAPTWRFHDLGTVALPLSKEAPVVSDVDVLTKWVAQRYPTEVEQVTVVRTAFLTRLLETGVCDGDAVIDPGSGEVVPGMRVRHGGLPQSLRVTPDREAKAVFAAVGEHLLEQLLKDKVVVFEVGDVMVAETAS